MVVKPVHSIGRYGGTWRRGFTGPGDVENGNRIVSTDKILFWDYTGTKHMPCVARDWKLSDDGRAVTIYLRKGMKWSDGQPFTTDDFLFWYEDIYLNKDIQADPEPGLHDRRASPARCGRSTTTRSSSSSRIRTTSSSTSWPAARRWAAAWRRRLARADDGRLHAGALPQAVPSQVRRRRTQLDTKVKESGLDGWVDPPEEPLGLAAQPRPADPDPVEDGLPQQQPQLGARAEPVLLRGGHAGQPASLHRPDPAWPSRRTWRC